jgi:predicted GNAT family acetyltransferase
MGLDITHDAAASRFEVALEGQRCVLDYRLADGVMTITHTGVPVAVRGRGIAAELVAAAFATARLQGWKVHPACSYAASWVHKHPDQADLLR